MLRYFHLYSNCPCFASYELICCYNFSLVATGHFLQQISGYLCFWSPSIIIWPLAGAQLSCSTDTLACCCWIKIISAEGMHTAHLLGCPNSQSATGYLTFLNPIFCSNIHYGTRLPHAHITLNYSGCPPLDTASLQLLISHTKSKLSSLKEKILVHFMFYEYLRGFSTI